MTNKDCNYYAQMYLEIIQESGKETFSLDDIESAFLSGWSNALLKQTISETDELMNEIKKRINDEFGDA